MLKQKINRGFTIIEILVVIIVIIIFVFIAWPNITNWTTDREVKHEVNSFVEYLKEKKAEVQGGKYPVIQVGVYASPKLWYMTHEEFGIQMKVPAPARTNRGKASQYNNKSIMNNSRACPSSPDNVDYSNWVKTNVGTYKWKNDTRHWPNIKICISKDAFLDPGTRHFDFTSLEKGRLEGALVICSAKNSTNSGSTRCNARNKIEHRRIIQIDRSLNILIYKYNLKKDKWILQ